MGRIATFLTGLFIIGASQGVAMLGTYASSIQGAPVDYGILVGYASMGLLGLGGAIAGYALLSAIFAIIKHNHQKRRDIRQEEQARRREQAQEQQQQQQNPQKRGQQQQRQGQQSRQQQQQAQSGQQGQRRQRSQDRDRQQQ